MIAIKENIIRKLCFFVLFIFRVERDVFVFCHCTFKTKHFLLNSDALTWQLAVKKKCHPSVIVLNLAIIKGGKKKKNFYITEGCKTDSPFSQVMDLFLSPCSSLIRPHLLPMSLSINESARNGLQCFDLSVSECSPTYRSKLIILHVLGDVMIMKLKCDLSA